MSLKAQIFCRDEKAYLEHAARKYKDHGAACKRLVRELMTCPVRPFSHEGRAVELDGFRDLMGRLPGGNFLIVKCLQNVF